MQFLSYKGLVNDMDTEVYLNICILVKKTNKSLHKMEKEINQAK